MGKSKKSEASQSVQMAPSSEDEGQQHKGHKERLSEVEGRLWTLEAKVTSMAMDEERVQKIETMHEELVLTVDQLDDNTRASFEHFTAEIAVLRETITDLRAMIKALTRTVESSGGRAEAHQAPLKVPEPRCYDGKQDAKELENFLFDMEQYFRVTRLNADEARVSTATWYLTGDAKLWWRKKVKAGADNLTWDELKRELTSQFMPENTMRMVWKKVTSLRHTDCIQDYVRKFSTAMLEDHGMSESTQFYIFMDGLKPWAQQELQRRNVRTLDEALVAAGRLTDYAPMEKSDRMERGKSPQPSRYQQSKGKQQSSGTQGSQHKDNSKNPTSPRQGLRCYLCGGSHLIRECPQKNALNALVAEQSSKTQKKKAAKPKSSTSGSDADDSSSSGERSSSKGKGKIHLGGMRLLNAMRTQVGESTPRENLNDLMYVNIKVIGRRGKALIDSGASHNFISAEVATRIGLRYKKAHSQVKSVDSEVRRAKGMATDVPIKIGAWRGHANFTIIPMDDYQIILGAEFLRTAQAMPIPFMNALCLMAGENPSVVQTIQWESNDKQKGPSETHVQQKTPVDIFKKKTPKADDAGKLGELSKSECDVEQGDPVQQLLAKLREKKVSMRASTS